MSKSVTNQRRVYKINSDRFVLHNWDLKLTDKEGIDNEEIVTLADSEVLRMIRQITNNKNDDNIIDDIKMNIKRLRKNKKDNRELLSIKQKELFNSEIIRDYLIIVFNSLGDWVNTQEINNPKDIKLNGKVYRRLLGTSGGVKKNAVVFVSDEIYAELDKRLNCGRNVEEKHIPAKFEAYKALSCSASTRVTQPKGVLVIKDPSVSFNDDVLLLKAKEIIIDDKVKKSNEFDLIESNRHLIEKEFADGSCMICPKLSEQWAIDLGEYHIDKDGNKVANYIPTGFNIRNAWVKGMEFTFPYIELADELYEKTKDENVYFVKDVWGNTHDIRNIELIVSTNQFKLWKSYDSWDDYESKTKQYGYGFSVAKILPKKLENVRNMNYQFLQSYDLNDEDIKELIKPTVECINGVCGKDDFNLAKMLLFLKGSKITESDFKREEMPYIKALMIDERMKNDPFIRQKINKMIKTRINDSKKGVDRKSVV